MKVGKLILVLCSVLLVSCSATESHRRRNKRAAYQLPDGIEFFVGSVRSTFQCPGDGYYADMDNGCQLFHVCHTFQKADGETDVQHFTFACGNQTVFNQLTMTCAYEDDSVPCENSRDFYYLNDILYQPQQPFLTDQDISRADPLITSRQRLAAPQPLETPFEEPPQTEPPPPPPPPQPRAPIRAPPPPPSPGNTVVRQPTRGGPRFSRQAAPRASQQARQARPARQTRQDFDIRRQRS